MQDHYVGTSPAYPDSVTRHFLTGEELSSTELSSLISRAAELKADRSGSSALERRTAALIFERPSTRTRVSVETGIAELGGYPLVLHEGEMQLSRGESIRDTAMVLSRFVHLIGIRTGPHATVEELAEHSSVPVVNLLTESHHPCQALADLQTLQERFGRLEGLTLTYVGDGNNVANSLMLLGAMAGVNVRIAAPEGFKPDGEITKRARSLDRGSVDLFDDAIDAANGADVLYTDVWVSMGDKNADERRAALRPFQINDELLCAASDDAIVLHCLPAHPGEEITEDVLYGRHSAVFDQAENRLHAQKALFEHLLAETT